MLPEYIDHTIRTARLLHTMPTFFRSPSSASCIACYFKSSCSCVWCILNLNYPRPSTLSDLASRQPDKPKPSSIQLQVAPHHPANTIAHFQVGTDIRISPTIAFLANQRSDAASPKQVLHPPAHFGGVIHRAAHQPRPAPARAAPYGLGTVQLVRRARLRYDPGIRGSSAFGALLTLRFLSSWPLCRQRSDSRFHASTPTPLAAPR